MYVVYQLWRKEDKLMVKVNKIFIVNALLNASWMFAWHYDLIWLSVIIMGGLLVTLIMIADIFRGCALTSKESWLVRLPFSVYFGWITVATIANITVFLVYLGWNGFGIPASFWTVLVLLVGTLIGSWRMLRDRFVPYGLVLIWAYGAILAKHLSISGFAGKYPSVIWTATLCLLVFLGTIVFISIKKKEVKFMKKILLPGLAAGVAMVIVNMFLNPIFNAIFPDLQKSYMNPVFRPWNDPIMMLFFVYPIMLGFGLSFVWDKTKQLFKKSICQNGINFGLIYFCVSGIPAFLINFSSFNLPLIMIVTWTIMGLVNGLVAGCVLAKLNKAK